MPTSAAERVERGLATTWARQVGWTDGGSLHHVGGLQVALSGVADQTQQVMVVEGPVSDPEASVIAGEALFARAGWNPAVDLLAGAHPALESVLVRRGYRVVVARPGMLRALDGVGAPRPAADGVVIRGAGAADRDGVVEVQARAFELDPSIATALLPPPTFHDPDAEVLVAEDAASGDIVGAVTVHVDGDLAGLVGAGVRPEHQRRGIGASLTRAALDVAARRGARAMWLQATDAGLPVYRMAGFEVVADCQVWVRSGVELREPAAPTGL